MPTEQAARELIGTLSTTTFLDSTEVPYLVEEFMPIILPALQAAEARGAERGRTGFQWRIVWKRKDTPQRQRVFAREATADRWYKMLTTDEYVGDDADSLMCCSGHMCCCGGVTNAEAWKERFSEFPPMVFVRIERRAIGDWESAARAEKEPDTSESEE